MVHVEPLFDPRELITALLFKCCDPGFSVDGDQSGFQVKMRTVAPDIFHKRRNIDWHTEQHGTGGVELHVDVLEDSGALPDVAREVHGLLWCTSALDRHDRLREQRSEEHTSELQSLMRISYAVFCLKKKNI